MRLGVVAVLSILSVPARAQTSALTGQPLCTTMDGLRMDVIEKGDATSGMHVDKVRIFGAKGSGVGYTMNVDP